MMVNNHPLDSVVWIDRNLLKANSYNPNIVAPPELELLKQSILEDGWTQPIVIREDYEIVDGFHRWTVSKDPKISKDGKVPVVFLKNKDLAHQMISTIRHNRARGKLYVVRMAEIVESLKSGFNIDDSEITKRLGMEEEEIERLYDKGNMLKRAAKEEFNKGWIPK